MNASKSNNGTEPKKGLLYDELIEGIWVTAISAPPVPVSDKIPENYIPCEDNHKTPRIMPETDNLVDTHGKAINTHPAYDLLTHTEIQLPQANNMQHTKVIGRYTRLDGKTSGTYNPQPHLNSIIYDVELGDDVISH